MELWRTITSLIQTISANGLNKMKFDDSIKDKIRKLDIKNPQFAFLLKQALEYWASLKDNDINNQLLQDLVLKYSAAEKKMKRLNQELLDKQKRLIVKKVWHNSSEMTAEVIRVTHHTENINNINIGAGFIILFASMCISLAGCYCAYKRRHQTEYLTHKNAAVVAVSKVVEA